MYVYISFAKYDLMAKKLTVGMASFVDMLSSGLSAALPRIVSATLRGLASALFNFSEDMELDIVQGLLEKVAEQMQSNNREIVAAAMSFLKVRFL
jgi:hypothetical protein